MKFFLTLYLQYISLFIIIVIQPLKAEQKDAIQVVDSIKIENLINACLESIHKNGNDAAKLANSALKLSKEISNKKLEGKAYLCLAKIYQSGAIYDKALEKIFFAFDIFKSIHETTLIATCKQIIGEIYEETGDYKNAFENYYQSLKLNKEHHDVPSIISNYNHIGSLHIKLDSIEKGLSIFFVVQLLSDSLDIKSEQFNVLIHIGDAYMKLNKPDISIIYYKKALNLCERNSEKYQISLALYKIGNALYEQKKYIQSFNFAEKSFNVASKSSFLNIAQNTSKILSDIYSLNANYKLAFEYRKIYNNYSDSINKSNSLKQITQLQVKYDLEKMEEENHKLMNEKADTEYRMLKTNQYAVIISIITTFTLIFLILLIRLNNKNQKLNIKLAEQSIELQKLNSNKDRFFSFVVHKLKNPFNIIMGFSELIIKHIQLGDKTKLLRYAKYIHSSSSGVQHILNNFVEWARLQKEDYEYNPETIDFYSIINDVIEVNKLQATKKRIQYNTQNISNQYVFADRHMLFTLLQNIISNAIKFSPEDSSIVMEAKKIKDFVEISIHDYGIGMDDDEIKHVFELNKGKNLSTNRQEKGTKELPGAGMGLVICKEIIHKHGGDIWVQSEPEKGSKFFFTLPVPKHTVKNLSKDDELRKVIYGIETNESTRIIADEAIRKELQTEFIQRYEEINKMMSIEDLRTFSHDLVLYARKKEIGILNEYASILNDYIDNYQIDKILTILPLFKKIIE